jgi:hypothetical protein
LQYVKITRSAELLDGKPYHYQKQTIDIFRYLHGDLGLIYCTQNHKIKRISGISHFGHFKEKTLKKVCFVLGK